MPSSPLIQLVAVGQSDEYLTLNPQVSYFKYVHKRHTRFAMESLKISFDGKAPSLKSSIDRCRVKIPRHGDLLADMHLVFTLPDIYSDSISDLRFRWIPNFATHFVSEANIYIGSLGKAIDTLYGEWMLIWNELSMSQSRKEQYNVLTGNVQEMINPKIYDPVIKVGKNNKLYYISYPYSDVSNRPSITSRQVAVPLNFYFTRSEMLYIPLCALQTSEVIVTVDIQNIESLYQVYDSAIEQYISPIEYNTKYNKTISIDNFVNTRDISPYIETKYVYLDETERKLITVNRRNNTFLVQNIYRKEVEVSEMSKTIDLDFNVPVKELIWFLRRRDYRSTNTLDNYTLDKYGRDNSEILSWAKLYWNKSNERVEEKESIYYGKIQPYQHHTSIPRTGIYCYSFALFPEKWQSSGYYNPGGRFPIKTSLQVGVNRKENEDVNYTITVYSVMYNILEIIGGMGSFKFAT